MGFALVAAALWLGPFRNTPAATARTNDARDERVAQLERELQQTRAELARVARAAVRSPARAHPAAASDDSADPAAIGAGATPGAVDDAARGAADDSDAAYLAFVGARFEQETSDPGWHAASELGSKLNEVLPAGSALRSLECRSSMCRIETTHRDLEAYRAFTEHFLLPGARAPLWSGAGFFHVTHEPQRPGDELVAVVYLGRESLPTAEPPR